MAYADEVLDGHRELVADAGTTITFTEHASGTFGALLVFPTAGSDTEHAGIQATAMDGVELERAFFVAAGVNQKSRFTVGDNPQVLQVSEIENDLGYPVVYLSSKEVQ